MMLPRETLAETWDETRMPAYDPTRYGGVRSGGIEQARVEAIADQLMAADHPVALDSLSRSQGRGGYRARSIGADLRHPGRRIHLDRPQIYRRTRPALRASILCCCWSRRISGSCWTPTSHSFRSTPSASMRSGGSRSTSTPEIGLPDVGLSNR